VEPALNGTSPSAGKGSYDATVVLDNRVFVWRRRTSFVFDIMEIDSIESVRFVVRHSLARLIIVVSFDTAIPIFHAT